MGCTIVVYRLNGLNAHKLGLSIAVGENENPASLHCFLTEILRFGNDDTARSMRRVFESPKDDLGVGEFIQDCIAPVELRERFAYRYLGNGVRERRQIR